MNEIERSIIQEKRTIGRKNEMTGDSKVLPIFPEYHMGGTQRILRVESYVRKMFNDRWYLIPVITQWESPTPYFGPDVLKDVIKQNQIEAYKALLYFKKVEPVANLHIQLLDINQEDERNRLGLELEYKKGLSDYVRNLWIKYIRGI